MALTCRVEEPSTASTAEVKTLHADVTFASESGNRTLSARPSAKFPVLVSISVKGQWLRVTLRPNRDRQIDPILPRRVGERPRVSGIDAACDRRAGERIEQVVGASALGRCSLDNGRR
jgi:hypothetical protein